MAGTAGVRTCIAYTRIHEAGAKVKVIDATRTWNPYEMRNGNPLRPRTIGTNRTHILVVMAFRRKCQLDKIGICSGNRRQLVIRLIIRADLVLGSRTAP